MDRKNTFFEMRVSQADVDEWFDDTEAAIWKLMEDALGFGFLADGAVTEHSPTPDLSVDVGKFLGYDQLGRRLYQSSGDAPKVVNCAVDEVAATTAVSTPGNEKTLALFVEFDRKLSDPRLDGNGVTVQYQVDESFKVNVVQSAEATVGNSVPPPLRNDQILIADVVLIYNQTAILNADIDQSRKEDFSFSAFLHGDSHRELGTDPAPNATTSDGGLLSGTDKTKLDGITWTPTAIGALLGFMGRAFNPANIAAPSATSMVVTGQMGGKTPGGDATTKGIITGAPANLVKIFNDDLDNFLDTDGNKVYGRITEAATVWTLSFFTIVEGTPGVETAFDMTPFSGQTIVWYVQEVHSLDSYPVADPMFAVQSDQIAGEVPDATTTVKGKVELATDGENAPNVVVQGNDSRLTGSGALALIRKMASRPSLIFMPKDSDPSSRYRLHQMHGLARGDHQAGSAPWEPADFYFEVDPNHADYPIEIFGRNDGSIAPSKAVPGVDSATLPGVIVGGSDNTVPVAVADQAYYVYLIGRTGATAPNVAIVFSDRTPWQNGPLLDDSSFAFWAGGTPVGDTGGWRYWRFIACVILAATPAGISDPWEFVVIRKKGNHVEYELAQRVVTKSANFPWGDVGLAVRVPPTSMRAFLRAYAQGQNGENATSIRPPAGGTMGLKEVPSVLLSLAHKLYANARDDDNVGIAYASDTGWVALNTARQVGMDFSTSGGTINTGSIDVLGYEEYDDVANAELSFG